MELKIDGLSLDEISHPSDTINELAKKFKIRNKEISKCIGIDGAEFLLFMKGKITIDNDNIAKLENIFPISDFFWINLNKTYEKNLEHVLELNNCSIKEAKLIEKILTHKISKDFISLEDNLIDQINKVRKFLHLNTLLEFDNKYALGIKFRKTKRSDVDKLNLGIYIRKILIENEGCYLINEFNVEKFNEVVPEIKKLTNLDDLFEIELRLQDILYKVGIQLILFPYEREMGVQGFISKDEGSISLGVSTKGKYFDIFWFTFFHEIGHLISRKTSSIFIDSDEENIVDQISQDFLIDKHEYEKFKKIGKYDNNSIVDFAAKIDVAPGIVVGRLQHDRLINYSDYNYLRARMK